jgi:multiple antibiotic resistance protein
MLTWFLLVFMGLLPIVNPPGSALLFLAMTRQAGGVERVELARSVAVYSFAIIFTSLTVGALVLKFFGISVPVLRVAGGLVLALSGWRVLDAPHSPAEIPLAGAPAVGNLKTMAFYPLTLPLTVGPGTVAVAIALGTSGSSAEDVSLAVKLTAVTGATLAILAISLLVYLCYRFADRLELVLGQRGSEALGRMFAFILICLGIEILWRGVVELWLSMPPR